MTASIILEDLRFYAFHGVFEHERKDGNEYIINLTVDYNFTETCKFSEDDIKDTISYVALFEIVKKEMDSPKRLLEKVAISIIDSIKAEFSNAVRVLCKITKVQPPIAGFDGKASVELIWGKTE